MRIPGGVNEGCFSGEVSGALIGLALPLLEMPSSPEVKVGPGLTE